MNVTLVKSHVKRRGVEAHWDVFHGQRQVGELFIEKTQAGMLSLVGLSYQENKPKHVFLCDANKEHTREHTDKLMTNALFLIGGVLEWNIVNK